MRFLAVLACVGALSFTPGALAVAQAVPVPPVKAEPVTTEKLALVRRYFDAIRYETLIDQMMASMMPVMVESVARQHPEITPSQQRDLVDTSREVMRETVTPKMMARVGPIFAATFTEGELRAIVDFYESPAGRAVTAKTPAMAPQTAQIVRDLMPEAQAEVFRRVCARFGCEPAQAPQPKAS